MRERNYAAAARTRLEQYYDNLKRSPKTAPLVAVIERFVEIGGLTHSGLLSVQLFTSIIPLIIIGFAYFSGFASNASVGELFIRDLGLHHPLDARVREAFGTPSGVQYVWTFLGLGAFLVWGIPMSRNRHNIRSGMVPPASRYGREAGPEPPGSSCTWEL